MSVSNVESSLSAATHALGQLNRSLGQAGFEEGAASYLKMSEILVGQALWLSSRDDERFRDELATVAQLAGDIRSALEPYVRAMERLLVLSDVGALVDDAPRLDEDQALVASSLASATAPVSTTWIRQRTRMPTHRLRDCLDEMSELGLLVRSGSPSRPLYAVGQASAAGRVAGDGTGGGS